MSSFCALGVVPIFVNVGAAALPAILAALASAAAMLLRPRELLRAMRRRPGTAALVVGLLVGAWFGGRALIRAFGRPARAAPADEIDWAKVALAMIRREELGATEGVPAPPHPPHAPTIFRQDASRCGHGGGPSPRRLAPLWEHSEPDAVYLSSPVVAGGWVFGASCVLDPFGNYGSLFCLDATTGQKRWLVDVLRDAAGREVELKGFFSSPAVTADGKYVVIGQGLHYDDNCALLCFEAQTGRPHWSVPTPLHIEGSPAIHGDLVVAGAGAIEDEQMRPVSDPGFVVGVRISDGRVLWRQPLVDPESSPVISDDGIAYIGSGFNGCELIALRTGPEDELKARGLERVVWRQKTPHPATGAVTLTEDLLLIGCGNGNYIYADPSPAGAVLAFDRRTGEKRWEAAMPDAVLGAVAARDGRGACAVRNGEVCGLELRKGKVAWRSRPAGNTPILTGPAFTGECVYVVSKDGYLLVLDAANGELLEKHYLNAEDKPGELGLSISSPTVAGGRVFVGSETGGLRCLVGRGAE